MRVRPLLCALALAGGLSTAAAAGEAVQLEVGDAISVKAEDVSLGQVLVELSEAVPFELVERGEAVAEPMSFDFQVATWEDAFGELLRGEGYTLTTDAATGRPEMLVVDWDVVGESLGLARTRAPVRGGAGDVEARIRAAAEELLKPRDHTADALDAVAAARDALLQARAHAKGAPGSSLWEDAVAKARAEYAEALRALGNHDDGRSVEALVEGLEEEDPEPRLGALEALRYQSMTAENPAALDQVTAALDAAPDPAHERAALEVLVRYADPADIMPTLEDLALTEGPNRDIAVREWLRIREEQEARARMEENGDLQLRQGESQ